MQRREEKRAGKGKFGGAATCVIFSFPNPRQHVRMWQTKGMCVKQHSFYYSRVGIWLSKAGVIKSVAAGLHIRVSMCEGKMPSRVASFSFGTFLLDEQKKSGNTFRYIHSSLLFSSMRKVTKESTSLL